MRDPGALAAHLGIPQGTVPIGVALVGHGAPDKPSRSLAPGPATPLCGAAPRALVRAARGPALTHTHRQG